MRDWSYSSGCACPGDVDFRSLLLLQRERVFPHKRGATNAPLRGDDCQFAFGFESANLRKNRRPRTHRSGLHSLIFLARFLGMTYGLRPQPEEEPTQVETRSRGEAHLWIRGFDHQVVRSWTGTGNVTCECAVARPELGTTAAESSISTRRAVSTGIGRAAWYPSQASSQSTARAWYRRMQFVFGRRGFLWGSWVATRMRSRTRKT